MIVCGIDLDSKGASLVVLDELQEVISTNKIAFDDHELKKSLLDFSKEMTRYLTDQNVELLVIKKRALKGKFVGSPLSFKMETLIQLTSFPIQFLTAAKLASVVKKKSLAIPDGLFKYFSAAYFSALIGLNQE